MTPLAVNLARESPLLELRLQSPRSIDAALIPVLIGPPGEGGAAPAVSRSLTWTNGLLSEITFADGRRKILTWTAEQLTRIDHIRPSQPTIRADINYSPDGLVSTVFVSQLP